MAGVKGRSGGARPGAGRKPTPATVVPDEVAAVEPGEPLDPRPTLEQIALGRLEVSPQQLKALLALLPYVHAKKDEGGKKERKQAQAEKVVSRFAPVSPPKLAAVGGGRI